MWSSSTSALAVWMAVLLPKTAPCCCSTPVMAGCPGPCLQSWLMTLLSHAAPNMSPSASQVHTFILKKRKKTSPFFHTSMYSFISFNTTELIPAKWSTHVTAVDVGDTEIVLCLVGAHDLFFFFQCFLKPHTIPLFHKSQPHSLSYDTIVSPRS